MYFNVYPTYVTTSDHVAKLSKKATSDSEAVLSWGSFIGGANGDVVIYPELEIFTQSYIAVTCRSSNMTLTLDRSAFPHLIPSRASLKDPSCKVVADDNFINVTTNWASCGTVVTYNESMAYYTNYIVPDILNPPDHTSDSEETVHAVINRGSIALDESRLFVTCKYDFVPHNSIAAYAVSSSTYSVKGKGARDFSFGLKLYHDSSYETAYREAEYPLHADSKERVFAQAQLSSSGEDRISIRVEKCVMTPDSDPDYSTHHNLLADGCAADDTVQYHDSPNSLAQRFSFEVFRFNERPTAVVFMHCYIDVCPSDDEDSKCKSGWTSCATESESESEGDAK
ncbi:oncoprotein-induced transcript 3 protein-like [Bolinopsis microptera]|uniref:oncoprotein-induced transcript 3 protein-like n=1 Tax=Bolinopsis microptera TaxID=2820187 RepID=UPI003079F356